MYRLIYISRFRPRTLQSSASDCTGEIARHARARNDELDLTGALIGTKNHFAQILEGEEVTVRSMMARICADRRHDLVKVISEGRVVARAFRDWSMACVAGSAALEQCIKTSLTRSGPHAEQDAILASLVMQYSKSRRSLSRLQTVREQAHLPLV